MYGKVKSTVAAYGLFSKGDSVLVALSGGPDSVALLYVCRKLAVKYDLRLFAAHLNHGLRGKEADRDEKFCVDLCKKLGVPVFTDKVKIDGFRAVEVTARTERYRFLEETALRVDAAKIATGHSADDQVETILMRFVRGAGTKGLSGIPPKRKLNESGLCVVRPLIGVWKEEILEFLNKGYIKYVLDSTNKNVDFFRNKIRRELIPVLSRYNPQIKEVVLSAGSNLAVVDDFLKGVVEEKYNEAVKPINAGFEVDRCMFNRCHSAVKQLLVKKVANIDLSARKVQEILALAGDGAGSKEVKLSKNMSVRREYDRLVFSKPKIKSKGFRKKLVVNGKTSIDESGVSIISRLLKRNSNGFFKRGPNEVELDYDSLKRPLIVRSRKPGDLYRPVGLNGRKKLNDIFIDGKLPSGQRDKVPVLTSGKDICWVAGYRIAEQFKITPKTKRILRVKTEV